MKLKVKWLVHFFKIFNVLCTLIYVLLSVYSTHWTVEDVITANNIEQIWFILPLKKGNLQYANQCIFIYNLFKS